MSDYEQLTACFRQTFDEDPLCIARAPGRVNLIGEHTDYNDGFVFPAAITYDVAIALTPREDGRVRLYSVTFGQQTEFDLGDIRKVTCLTWSNYIRGVADVLQKSGHSLRGMDAAITGDVPVSSGLSSSAALEVASCLAFEAASGFSLPPVDRAKLCQRAEREFVGVQCGIMDQFISALGRRDHALFLDTRTLEYEAVPLPSSGVEIVISNTNKPRGLTGTEYNKRRSECEQAVAVLKKHLGGITALRDVTLDQLLRYRDELDPVVFRRARHVITENDRVVESVRALKAGDLQAFGRLMNDSHRSLRDDYEVSCAELDTLVEAALDVEGVYGSRMTGAGFGGCTVSLVASDSVEEFTRTVGEKYAQAARREATFYVCRAADGASTMPPPAVG